MVLVFVINPIFGGAFPFGSSESIWDDVVGLLVLAACPLVYGFAYVKHYGHTNEIRGALQSAKLTVEANVADGVATLQWQAVRKYPMTVLGYRCEGAAPHSPSEAAERGVLIVNSREWSGEYRDHDAEGGSIYYSFHLEEPFQYETGFFLDTPASTTIQVAQVVRSVRVPGEAVSESDIQKMRRLREKLEVERDVAELREDLRTGSEGWQGKIMDSLRGFNTPLEQIKFLREQERVREAEIDVMDESDDIKEMLKEQLKADVEHFQDKIVTNSLK